MMLDPKRPTALPSVFVGLPLRVLAAVCWVLAAACAGSADGGEGPPSAESAESPTPVEPRFVAQEGWDENAEHSPMRMAEFVLPGEGEGLVAVLAVSGWPNGVGTLESNVQRWVGQVGLDTSASALSAEQRWIEEPREFVVTMVHVEGALQALPGMASDVATSGNDALLAAFIERPPSSAVWTAKVTGPAATVRAHRDRFIEFIRAL